MTQMRLLVKRLSLVLLAAVASAIAACHAQPLPLRKDPQELRQQFLQQTPLGTPLGEVLERLKAEGLNVSPVKNTGFLRQEAGQQMAVVGESSVSAELGSYWTFPFLTTTVTGFWGFDVGGKLADVWIWKTTDAP